MTKFEHFATMRHAYELALKTFVDAKSADEARNEISRMHAACCDASYLALREHREAGRESGSGPEEQAVGLGLRSGFAR